MALPPFQAFVEEHRERVHRFLLAAVGPDEADDCFQETFIAALRAYPRLRDGSNLGAWVIKIAQRKAIDAHRARVRRPLPVEALEQIAGEQQEDHSWIWQSVAELPPKQRGAILCRYAGEMTYAETATALDCSQEAARRSVHEGLKRLREELS